MKLSELLKKREICRSFGDPDTEITGLACKLSEIENGSLFFCFAGTNTDSHLLCVEAEKRGAAAFVCERDIDVGNYAVVRDSRLIMSRVAKRFYGSKIDKMKLLTVTGTNGKTTTTYILDSIFRAAGYITGVIGTCGVKIGDSLFENSMTTPDPIDMHRIFAEMYDAGVQVVIMEVSAHGIALKKMEGTCADCAVLTNVTQDHLDFFKTMKRYKKTKLSYFSPEYTKLSVVNADDESGRELIESCKTELVTYGVRETADFAAINVEANMCGVCYIMLYGGVMRNVKFSTPGYFNVSNSLGAIAAAVCLGVSADTAVAAVAACAGVDGRFNVIDIAKGAHVVIDYAHTPDGLKNVLSSVRAATCGKVISVFGCGGNRDRAKRAVMGRIASELSDLVVLTSDNPRYESPEDIIGDIERGIDRRRYYVALASREEAIKYALEFAGSGDVVVIAGKGHETYQEIAGKKYNFSDRDTVMKYADN